MISDFGTAGIAIRISSVLFAVFVLCIRFSKRLYNAVRFSLSRKNSGKVRSMIVGGGNAGAMLIREIQTTDKITYLPVVVIDDDPNKIGKSINNVRIVGDTAPSIRSAAPTVFNVSIIPTDINTIK